MIRTLREEEQLKFDGLVEVIRDTAKHNLSLYFTINGDDTPNFTNYLEVIEYGNLQALVKTSKFFSGLIRSGKSLIDWLNQKHVEPLHSGNIHQFEGGILDELYQAGAPVPERIYTSVEDVLIVKYYKGESTKKVLRNDLRYRDILLKLSYGLAQIHQFGLHMQPSTNNTFVFEGNGYWSDFETFSMNNGIKERANELSKFIKSAARHSYRDIDAIKGIVFEGYQDSKVVDLARNLL